MLNRRETLRAALALAGTAGIGARCTAQTTAVSGYRPADVLRGPAGMAVSNSAAASSAGRDILAAGGNAVDAAVAVAFALAVTWPEAGNIGGGGFMMIAPPEQDPLCVDYRETAPQAVTATTLAEQTDRRHPRMVGVPGTVRGLALAQQSHGRLSWQAVLQPAIALAAGGCVVEAPLADSLNAVLAAVSKSTAPWHRPLEQTFGHPQRRRWRAGDRLVQPVLAATLQRIAEEGPDEFYSGQTARSLADYFEQHQGLITAEDLEGYQAVLRQPIRTNFAGHQVWAAPPPSSGGVALRLALQMIEHVGMPDPGDAAWTPMTVHIVAEAMRRTFRERAAYLGDPDFTPLPAWLGRRTHAAKLAESISRSRATDSRTLAGDIPLETGPVESPQTTHFSVIDAEGMAVSNTYTLEASWGSWLLDPATGFVLNNEMGDFNPVPGVTDLKGQIGTAPNQLAPGKRMLSSQTPTIVRRDGKTVLITGSPGGRTIINTVLCVLVQHLLFARPLPEAIAAPRFHHGWLPDQLRIETGGQSRLGELRGRLESLGHRVVETRGQGAAHSIAIEPASGIRVGVADGRRGGRVAATLIG